MFADRTSQVPRVDLDVGDPLSGDDSDATHRRAVAGGDVGLSELEPVTMSEVGTKLDLARAYMDMGDPDGARNILEEVLSEGSRIAEAGSAAPDRVAARLSAGPRGLRNASIRGRPRVRRHARTPAGSPSRTPADVQDVVQTRAVARRRSSR